MKIKEILIGIRDWALGKLSAKQDLLVSGENIKSINNESLLGEGNISIPTESDIVWEKGTGDNSIQQKGTGASAAVPSAVAEGGDNLEGGEPSEGEEKLYSKAEGYASHAEGAAHAIGRYSHAEGGGNSIVTGKNTVPTAEGAYSHAEGTHTYAKGTAAHVEGNQTEAEGYAGHAEGQETYAKGFVSHSEGWKTQANGAQSHAEGYLSKTTAANAHAEGLDTRAFNEAEHAEGAYNKSNTGNSIAQKTRHSVGIGTSTTRKNAFEIMQNGDAYFYGVGTYNGTNPISGKNDLKTILNNKKNKSETIVTSFSPFNNVSYTVRASDNQTLSNLATLIAASGYEAKALNFLEFATDDNYEAICLQENVDECKFVRISSWYNMEDGSTKTTYLYDNPADNIRKVLTIVITIDNDTREFDSASFELKDAPTSGSGTEPLFVDCNYDPYNHTIDSYSDVEVPFQEVATAFDSGRPVIFRDGANEFSGLLIACHNGAGWGSCAVGSPDGIVTISIT